MALIRRKDKITEVCDSSKIFVPGADAFRQDPPVAAEADMEQYPKKQEEPTVDVGIMSAAEITFELDSPFRCEILGKELPAGCYHISAEADKLRFLDKLYDNLEFVPVNPRHYTDSQGYFALHDVIIGVDFHWQRRETQRFKGLLRFVANGGKTIAINRIGTEAYLYSVIASEMNATASLELLKAHAVISRSWLLAPMLHPEKVAHKAVCEQVLDEEITRWYERDAHELFDVCADDHCQRYQGIVRARTPDVKAAIEATRGEVLTHNGQICDARFSKSCGGVSELFENCWADEHHPYLEAIKDEGINRPVPDLTTEEAAEKWIRSKPACFCNTADRNILSQVLNTYDFETTDFFRWTKTYRQDELSELVKRRSGIDFGTVTDLIPLKRGTSGRIVRLKIVGTKRTLIVGKELEIRKWLSESHLYSSAFVVDRDPEGNFTLTGAGWGHGVGLCQIGAAVMGAQGYDYKQILQHYFTGARISRIYD